MSAVLGIKAIQPCPHGELRVIYDLGGDKTATLAIYSDVQKRVLTGASVSDLPSCNDETLMGFFCFSPSC